MSLKVQETTPARSSPPTEASSYALPPVESIAAPPPLPANRPLANLRRLPLRPLLLVVGLLLAAWFAYYFYQNTFALPLPDVRIMNQASFQSRLAFPPEGNNLIAQPVGLVVDSKGNIYVANRETNSVREFDPTGNAVANWPLFNEFSDKQVATIAIYNDHIYALDKASDHINVYDTSGKLLTVHNQDGKLPFSSPNGFCLDDAGNIYIASTAGNAVVKIDDQDHLLGVIGSKNLISKQRQLDQPFACAISSDGSIYAVNISGIIQKYDKDGNYVHSLPTHWLGTTVADGIRMTADRPHHRIYIGDSGDDILIMIDTSTDAISAYGSAGHDPGHFTHIAAVAVNANGDVYTVEAEERRIQVFNRP